MIINETINRDLIYAERSLWDMLGCLLDSGIFENYRKFYRDRNHAALFQIKKSSSKSNSCSLTFPNSAVEH